ncbi:hypothetical protein A2U01_0042193, partial [Trifolium medium]|nr:hypothetical protein [Trifolium medium]
QKETAEQEKESIAAVSKAPPNPSSPFLKHHCTPPTSAKKGQERNRPATTVASAGAAAAGESETERERVRVKEST